MDTPGGSVLGLRSAADALLSLQEQRPDLSVMSYAQRLNASAGMYLAAATQAFHAAPGAYVGSIGTIAALTDYSGMKEKFGISTRVYTADSTLKDLGRGPITAAHDAHMTEMVQSYSDEFKNWMSARRGVAPGAMHGQAWEARLAPAGITDSTAFVTFAEFLATALGL
jgi:ClpP class serine protease